MRTNGLREKNCRNARQPADAHRRVLWARFLFSFDKCMFFSVRY